MNTTIAPSAGSTGDKEYCTQVITAGSGQIKNNYLCNQPALGVAGLSDIHKRKKPIRKTAGIKFS